MSRALMRRRGIEHAAGAPAGLTYGIGTPVAVGGLTSTSLSSAVSSTMPNPERGFYYYTESHYTVDSSNPSTSGFAPLSQSDLENQRTTNGYTIVFRYYYMEVFNTNGSTISTTYTNQVAADFVTARAAGMKLIIRFAYTNVEQGPPYLSEPSVSTVESHVASLMPIIDPNGDILLAIQAGFIGTWGEWYYSDNFTNTPSNPGSLDSTDWTNRGNVLTAIVNGTATADCFVQVRYLGIKQMLYPNDTTRIGFHNDSFLADANDDYGTYTTFTSLSASQNETYLAEQTAYPLILTGETNNQDSPNSDWPSASAQLAEYHWTALNPDYNTAVLDSWGSNLTTAEENMGYLMVGSACRHPATAAPGTNIRIEVDIYNDGYAAPMHNRTMSVTLDNQSGTRYDNVMTGLDFRTLSPSGSYYTIWADVPIPSNAPAGTYQIALWFPDSNSSISSRVEYAVQMANSGTWNSTYGYNQLATITIT